MKNYKAYIAMVLAGGILAACADTEMDPFYVDAPQSTIDYEYLDSYADLKSYIDRAAHPGFLLGTGVLAADYNKKGLEYLLTNKNFDIITAGNEMKYDAVVDNKGNMNFYTVKEFVNNARAAGMQIYGHTLCWHEQQNYKWLNSVIAGKEITGSGETEMIEDFNQTYDSFTEFPFYVMDTKPDIKDGNLYVANPEATDNYKVQYFVCYDFPANPEYTYVLTAKIKSDTDGGIAVVMGNWGQDVSAGTLAVTGDNQWHEVSVKCSGITSGNSFVIFQSGALVGNYEIESVKVSHSEAKVDKVKVPLETYDFTDDHRLGGWGSDVTYEVVDGVFVIDNTKEAEDDWDKQVCYEVTTPFELGQTYCVDMRIRASQKGMFAASYQKSDGYVGCGSLGNVSLDTDWQDVTIRGEVTGEGANRLLFNVGKYVGKIEIASMMVYYEKPANIIELTPEEKAEKIEAEMERWVAGMMQATGGYVTAWDVVNEPLSGGPWGQRYDLQHAVNDPDAPRKFYWQDYLGDNYVRVPVKYARKYFEENGGNPADLKLFINDYNLESDWDDNQKLKSLISWIEQWESDGVTKIDGIGSQMHISYYLDPETQRSKSEHVEKMLRLMAATGKLVRITELDMGLVDETGKDIPTAEVTLEQHKLMGDYYKWIVSKYFEIVPPAQQFGITHWCQTDSPEGSGWRPNQPVGLWNLNFSRKPAYAGFAEGLAEGRSDDE